MLESRLHWLKSLANFFLAWVLIENMKQKGQKSHLAASRSSMNLAIFRLSAKGKLELGEELAKVLK